MRTIWKFPFEIKSPVEISMPEFSRILQHVEVQDSQPYLWAIVDTEQPVVSVYFHLMGAGHALPNSLSKQSHIATFQSGRDVWHLFLAE